MDSFSDAWSLICDHCKTKITDVAYKAWIGRVKPANIDFSSGRAVVVAPTEFHKQTLKKCYLPLLTSAFDEVFGPGINLDIITSGEDILEKNSSGEEIGEGEEEEFTFNTYIVGSSNKFAHAAAMAVAANPARAYNPLFIYGNSGLGKTHLLYAICNEVKHSKKNLTPVYIKGDGFTNELINSIKKNTTSEFHEKYRKADIFLVDDIQFIAGKDSTQEEFFHTFNSLYEAKKQIVLTSDRPPKEIQTLEDRLRTRFEWGLIADIQTPDFETRIAIVKRKAELLQVNLPNDVTEFIATKLKANIRQLEGAVKKMKAYLLLKKQEPNITTAKEAISDTLNSDQSPTVTLEKIIEETARTFGVSNEDIKSSKRSATISNARQAAIYICREITQLSTTVIGEEFGGRNHSTISYAIQQVEKNMKKDRTIQATIQDIIKNMRGA
ncbi:MAG: chromosomal replication initiator protein DnaA [Oscillospiraceae bacterium]|jgi:chromosomal replication initiator protein|nr:chromosomal replication initiator protein DnaA [Oscillospiraceae bacterium]